MLERDVVNGILKWFKGVPECFAWKEHGGMYGHAGLPDIICCYRGRFVAFEVKRPKSDGTGANGAGGKKHPEGKLSKLQEITIQRIQDAKGSAYKVTTLQEVKEIIKNLGLEEDNHCENKIENNGRENEFENIGNEYMGNVNREARVGIKRADVHGGKRE